MNNFWLNPLFWLCLVLIVLAGMRFYVTRRERAGQVLAVRFGRNDIHTIPDVLVKKGEQLWVMTDPVGSEKSMHYYSELAFLTVKLLFHKEGRQESPGDFLRKCLETAHKKVTESMNYESGGCSMALVYVKNGRFYWGSAGNIGIYFYRNELVRLNRMDLYKHKLSAAVLERKLDEKTAASTLLKDELTSYLGHERLDDPEIGTDGILLEQSDYILTATKSIYQIIPPITFEQIIQADANILKKMRKIYELYKSKKHGNTVAEAKIILGTGLKKTNLLFK